MKEKGIELNNLPSIENYTNTNSFFSIKKVSYIAPLTKNIQFVVIISQLKIITQILQMHLFVGMS